MNAHAVRVEHLVSFRSQNGHLDTAGGSFIKKSLLRRNTTGWVFVVLQFEDLLCVFVTQLYIDISGKEELLLNKVSFDRASYDLVFESVL